MKLNTEKTQVIHFRVKRKIKTKQEFYFGPNKLETVNDYKYLGVKFNEYLDKQVPGDSLADGATRALGKLLSKYHLNKGLGLKTGPAKIRILIWAGPDQNP